MADKSAIETYGDQVASVTGLRRGGFRKRNREMNQRIKAGKTFFNSIQGEAHEAERAAMYDPLTGLVRKENGERIFRRLLDGFNRGKPFASIGAEQETNFDRVENFIALGLDLDYFKWLNEILGHEMGDMILEECGRFIRNSFRPLDILIRDGGEEFLALIINSDIKGKSLGEETKGIIERFSREFNGNFLKHFIKSRLVASDERRSAKDNGMFKETERITGAVRVMLQNLIDLQQNRIKEVRQNDRVVRMSAQEYFMSLPGSEDKKRDFLNNLSGIFHLENTINDEADLGRHYLEWYMNDQSPNRILAEREDKWVYLSQRNLVEAHFIPAVLNILFGSITISGAAVYTDHDSGPLSYENVKAAIETARTAVKQSGRARIDEVKL